MVFCLPAWPTTLAAIYKSLQLRRLGLALLSVLAPLVLAISFATCPLKGRRKIGGSITAIAEHSNLALALGDPLRLAAAHWAAPSSIATGLTHELLASLFRA